MSRGYAAHANKVLEDEQLVIYEYAGFNWNDPLYYNDEHILDGVITIQKSCFREPDIHEKLKRMPSGRKRLVTKRIPVYAEYDKYLREGLVTIENCSNCWKVTDDELHVDIMACKLLFKIFLEYQEDSKIPNSMSLAY